MTLRPFLKTALLPLRQRHKHMNTNPFKQPVMYSQCITQSSSRKVTHTHHSARGESLKSGFPLLPPGYSLWRFLVRRVSEALWRYQGKWQSKAVASISHCRCLSRATLMWWLLFALWCGGAVRLVGLSRLCLLVCWAWQSLWWSSD